MEDENDSSQKELPGPPPDPSSIPSVVREVGDLDPVSYTHLTLPTIVSV